MRNKFFLGILLLILITALYLRMRDSFPVISVEGEKMSRENFTDQRAGFIQFRDMNKDKITNEEIEKGILLNFIQDSLAKKKLEEFGQNEEVIKKAVETGIPENSGENFEKATMQLYGWSIQDFKDYVLEPQARRAILAEELSARNIEFESWLEKSTFEAKITVYMLRWKWDGEELKKRF